MGLFHTACISTVMGHSNPRTCGHLQAPLRSAMGTVPEQVEAVGVRPACGHDTRVQGEDVLVAVGNNVDHSRVVEADNIHVARKAARKGFFLRRTVAAQMTACHAAWPHEPQAPQGTQAFLLGFLEVLHAYPYPLKQPHGSCSLSVEGDTQPSWMTTRVATLSSTKTVRSIELINHWFSSLGFIT